MHLTIIKQQFKQDILLYVIKTHFAFFSLLFYSLITPLPSWPKPLFQSEAKYEAIDIKNVMNCYSPAKTANNTHFHKKGFESGSLWNSEMAYSRENKK